MDPLYLVEHFDPTDTDRCGWFTCDREMTRRNVVEGIADGQMECVVKVLEIREDRTWRDITFPIAEEVEFHALTHSGNFSYEVLTFLQSQGLRQHQMAD